MKFALCFCWVLLHLFVFISWPAIKTAFSNNGRAFPADISNACLRPDYKLIAFASLDGQQFQIVTADSSSPAIGALAIGFLRKLSKSGKSFGHGIAKAIKKPSRGGGRGGGRKRGRPRSRLRSHDMDHSSDFDDGFDDDFDPIDSPPKSRNRRKGKKRRGKTRKKSRDRHRDGGDWPMEMDDEMHPFVPEHEQHGAGVPGSRSVEIAGGDNEAEMEGGRHHWPSHADGHPGELEHFVDPSHPNQTNNFEANGQWPEGPHHTESSHPNSSVNPMDHQREKGHGHSQNHDGKRHNSGLHGHQGESDWPPAEGRQEHGQQPKRPTTRKEHGHLADEHHQGQKDGLHPEHRDHSTGERARDFGGGRGREQTGFDGFDEDHMDLGEIERLHKSADARIGADTETHVEEGRDEEKGHQHRHPDPFEDDDDNHLKPETVSQMDSMEEFRKRQEPKEEKSGSNEWGNIGKEKSGSDERMKSEANWGKKHSAEGNSDENFPGRMPPKQNQHHKEVPPPHSHNPPFEDENHLNDHNHLVPESHESGGSPVGPFDQKLSSTESNRSSEEERKRSHQMLDKSGQSEAGDDNRQKPADSHHDSVQQPPMRTTSNGIEEPPEQPHPNGLDDHRWDWDQRQKTHEGQQQQQRSLSDMSEHNGQLHDRSHSFGGGLESERLLSGMTDNVNTESEERDGSSGHLDGEVHADAMGHVGEADANEDHHFPGPNNAGAGGEVDQPGMDDRHGSLHREHTSSTGLKSAGHLDDPADIAGPPPDADPHGLPHIHDQRQQTPDLHGNQFHGNPSDQQQEDHFSHQQHGHGLPHQQNGHGDTLSDTIPPNAHQHLHRQNGHNSPLLHKNHLTRYDSEQQPETMPETSGFNGANHQGQQQHLLPHHNQPKDDHAHDETSRSSPSEQQFGDERTHRQTTGGEQMDREQGGAEGPPDGMENLSRQLSLINQPAEASTLPLSSNQVHNPDGQAADQSDHQHQPGPFQHHQMSHQTPPSHQRQHGHLHSQQPDTHSSSLLPDDHLHGGSDTPTPPRDASQGMENQRHLSPQTNPPPHFDDQHGHSQQHGAEPPGVPPATQIQQVLPHHDLLHTPTSLPPEHHSQLLPTTDPVSHQDKNLPAFNTHTDKPHSDVPMEEHGHLHSHQPNTHSNLTTSPSATHPIDHGPKRDPSSSGHGLGRMDPHQHDGQHHGGSLDQNTKKRHHISAFPHRNHLFRYDSMEQAKRARMISDLRQSLPKRMKPVIPKEALLTHQHPTDGIHHDEHTQGVGGGGGHHDPHSQHLHQPNVVNHSPVNGAHGNGNPPAAPVNTHQQNNHGHHLGPAGGHGTTHGSPTADVMSPGGHGAVTAGTNGSNINAPAAADHQKHKEERPLQGFLNKFVHPEKTANHNGGPSKLAHGHHVGTSRSVELHGGSHMVEEEIGNNNVAAEVHTNNKPASHGDSKSSHVNSQQNPPNPSSQHGFGGQSAAGGHPQNGDHHKTPTQHHNQTQHHNNNNHPQPNHAHPVHPPPPAHQQAHHPVHKSEQTHSPKFHPHNKPNSQGTHVDGSHLNGKKAEHDENHHFGKNLASAVADDGQMKMDRAMESINLAHHNLNEAKKSLLAGNHHGTK